MSISSTRKLFKTERGAAIATGSAMSWAVAAALLLGLLVFLIPRLSAGQDVTAAGLQVEELEIEPPIAWSGTDVEVRGILRNATHQPMHAVFAAAAVSTDPSPGLQVQFAANGGVRGLPILPPGGRLQFRDVIRFTGDGWARAGVMGWSAEDTGLPATKRVLIVDPALSTIELVTLLALLALGVSLLIAAVLGLRRFGFGPTEARRRWLFVSSISVVSAGLVWAGGLYVRMQEPTVLRLSMYLGGSLLAVAWLAATFALTRPRSARHVASVVTLYLGAGLSWIVSFNVWLGLRPTAVASDPGLLAQIPLWPLYAAQILFGLHFA